MEDAVEWGEKALKLADQFDATEIRVHALNNVGVARAFRNDRTGVDMLEKSLAISMENGFHEHAARVYTNLSEYGVEFKEFDLAERVIMEGIAFDTRNDLDSWTHYLVGRQAQLRCEQGRLYDARAIAEGVLQLERQTKLMKLPSRLVLAKVKTLFGDDNANQVLGNATDHASATEEPQHIVPAHLTRLLYAWLNNQPRMAEESLYAVFDIGAEVMHLWHRGDVVIWGKRFGYQVPEEFLVDLPAPMRLEINGDIAGAAAKWKKLGAPVSHALALSQSAEPKLLAQAIEITQDIGAAAIEKTVLQRAKSIGVDDKLPNRRRGPYKASRNHPLGLTQKEQTVLSLLVEGRSNPEIADITSRSKRTIENHVSSILRKLNVENRMDATILVQSEPWLLPNGDKSSGA
jgi:DNA-binding CsgD family transcriptional regulator